MKFLKANISSRPDTAFLLDLKSLCRKENVVFINPEDLYCCGTPMYTGIGPLGLDYACCGCCGKILANIASPRINGGIIPNNAFFQHHGNSTWVCTGAHGAGAAHARQNHNSGVSGERA
jgi:hypothetical protein